ncbi:MAG: hypothetical protein ACOX4M_09850 [Acetivibrionales bacterium]|jgi:hypothetical protein
MTLKELLNSWNVIDVPNDDFVFEQLCSTNPDNCFFIDRFPIRVESFNKYSQLEVFYDSVLNGDLCAEIYLKEEEKIKNILKKLWLYSFLEVETNLAFIEDEKITKVIDASKMPFVEELRKMAGEELFTVENVDHLDTLLELGLRDRVESCFVFSDLEIVAWINGLIVLLYMVNLEKKALVEKIVCTEGMYLRPYKQAE